VKKILFLFCAVFFISACSDNTDEHDVIYVTEPLAEVTFTENKEERLLFKHLDIDNMLWIMSVIDNEYFVRTFNVSEADSNNIDFLSGHEVISFSYEYPVVGFTVLNDIITLLTEENKKLVVSQFYLNGTERFEVSIDFQEDADFYFSSIITDIRERLYIAWFTVGDLPQHFQSGVTVLNGTGEHLFTLSGNYVVNDLTMLSNDVIYALVDEAKLQEIDIENKSWGQSINLYEQFRSVYRGNENNVYLSSYTHIYKFDFLNGELNRILLLQEAEITGQINWLSVQDDETVIIGAGTGNIYRIKPVIPINESIYSNDDRERISLALSIPTDPSVMAEVIRFNRENDEYRIDIYEISSHNIHRFRMEVMTGQLPDIIFYGSSWDILRREVPSHRLAVRGLLADLLGFIDDDHELSRDSFLPNIIEATLKNDAIYDLPYIFWLSVAAGNADLLGTDLGWTFKEMSELLDSIKFDGYLFGPNINNDSALSMILNFLVDDFVEWDTGNVFFDSQDFIELLNIVKKYTPYNSAESTEFEGELTSQGRQLMMWHTFTAPNGLQYLDYYFENMVPIGVPASTGVGNSIRYDNSFSISSASESADVAWSFIRQFYLPEFYAENPSYIPVHVDAIDIWFSRKDLAFTVGHGPYIINIGETTQHDIERIKTVLEFATRVSRLDNNIYFIISEEADAYFRGIRSAEDTAGIIQNKIQTLVWEEMK